MGEEASEDNHSEARHDLKRNSADDARVGQHSHWNRYAEARSRYLSERPEYSCALRLVGWLVPGAESNHPHGEVEAILRYEQDTNARLPAARRAAGEQEVWLARSCMDAVKGRQTASAADNWILSDDGSDI